MKFLKVYKALFPQLISFEDEIAKNHLDFHVRTYMQHSDYYMNTVYCVYYMYTVHGVPINMGIETI